MGKTMELGKQTTRRAQLREVRKRDAQRNKFALIVGAVALLGIALVAIWASGGSSETQTISRAVIGTPLSDFALTDLNGATHQVSALKGKVVLINAWATWCPPCRAEMPALHDFYIAHQAEGFALLAVNAGEDAGTAQAFIDQMGFTFPVLLDPGTNVLAGLGIDAFPTSVLVDRNGNVAKIHVGYYSEQDVAADILPLLAQ